MTDHHNQREAIARIIDHEGYWERLDNLNAVIRAGIASDDQHMELCHKRDEEIAGTEESLSKADQIIAMQSQGPEPVAWADAASPLDAKLETECRNMRGDAAALYSIAISLKRLADFVDGPERLNIVEYLAQELRHDR